MLSSATSGLLLVLLLALLSSLCYADFRRGDERVFVFCDNNEDLYQTFVSLDLEGDLDNLEANETGTLENAFQETYNGFTQTCDPFFRQIVSVESIYYSEEQASERRRRRRLLDVVTTTNCTIFSETIEVNNSTFLLDATIDSTLALIADALNTADDDTVPTTTVTNEALLLDYIDFLTDFTNTANLAEYLDETFEFDTIHFAKLWLSSTNSTFTIPSEWDNLLNPTLKPLNLTHSVLEGQNCTNYTTVVDNVRPRSTGFFLDVRYTCRGCPQDTNLFDDGIERRRRGLSLYQDTMPEQQNLRSYSSNSLIDHRHLQSDPECTCTAESVADDQLLRAPTSEEFTEVYNDTIVSLVEDEVLQNVEFIATVVTERDPRQIGSDIFGASPGDNAGQGMALSQDGRILALGSPEHDRVGTEDASDNTGHVRVFVWDGAEWSQLGNAIEGRAPGDRAGYSVALSADGSILAFGSPFHYGSGGFAEPGEVRVYEWDGLEWQQKGSDIEGQAYPDSCGWSVALSSDGMVLAVGARRNGGTEVTSRRGNVRVFEWSRNGWEQIFNDIVGEASNDESGSAVAMSEDGMYVAVGALYNDGSNGRDSGHVRVYERGDGWILRGSELDGATAQDWFGYSVALSNDGSTLAVGSPRYDSDVSDSGLVQVFQWLSGQWQQVGSDLEGVGKTDFFGWSVDLNGNGTILAVGATENDGGFGPGYVTVYRWEEFEEGGADWIQVGERIVGDVLLDNAGRSLSISSNGEVLAVGTPLSTDNAGHARIYDLSRIF